MFHFGGGIPGDMGGGRRRQSNVDTTEFYNLLGIEKSASQADVKKAYRKMAIKHHPDKGGDPDMFKKVSRAYEILSDNEKRAKYDQFGEEGVDDGAGEGGDPSDIFDMFFGGGGKRAGRGNQQKRGENITHPLEVTLAQLYAGATKRLAINREVVDTDVGIKECRGCDGKGIKMQVIRMGPMIQQMQSACNDCGGQGKSYKTKKEREILEVYIDKGAKDGHKIPFRGKADEKPGYETGDVVFVVQEKEHAEFKRKGADLTIKRKISLFEALCGFQVEVTHLDGRKLLIKSKPDDIIKPKTHNNPSAMWKVFENSTIAVDSAARAKAVDVEQLKEVALEKGFFAFCVDTEENHTSFWNMSHEECMAAKVSNRDSKNKRLYISPDPKELAKSRMTKCVPNEGMPTMRNPMLKGNLFIELEIEFPEEGFSSEQKAKLAKLLPPALNKVQETQEHEVVFMEEDDPVESAKRNQSNNTAYDEDEDQSSRGHGHGGQAVNCAQQ